MLNQNTTCIKCPFRSLIFDKLTDEEFGLLENSRVVNRYYPGDIIIAEGQPVREFIYLKSGLVKLIRKSTDGREHIVSVAKTKSFIGFLTLFSHTSYQYSIVALTNTELCMIESDLIKKLVRSNPDFALDVIEKISEASDEIIYHRMNICAKNLRGRIAYLLLLMSQKINYSVQFYLPLTRREIGELIHMSTANVIRVFTEFKKDNLIRIDGHTVTLLDVKTLERISKAG